MKSHAGEVVIVDGQRMVRTPAGGLITEKRFHEMITPRRQYEPPPPLVRSEEEARALLERGLEKMNPGAFLCALRDSLTYSIGQAQLVGKVFDLLSTARQMAGFIIDDLALESIAGKTGQFSSSVECRRRIPGPAPEPDQEVRKQIDEIAAKAQREATVCLMEQVLRLCQARDTDVPLDMGNVSRVLRNIGVDEKSANVRSLNARLQRMRKSGFQQLESGGRGRRRTNRPTNPKKPQSVETPWLNAHMKILRLVIHEAINEPANANQDRDTTIATGVLSTLLMDPEWVMEYVAKFRAANPELASKLLGEE